MPGKKRSNQMLPQIPFPLLLVMAAALVIRMYAVALCFGGLFLLALWYRSYKKKQYENSDFFKIDQMTGEQFEYYLKLKFENMGYKVKLTPVTGDYGADLILTRQGERTVVQAKRYSRLVGIQAVQEVIGSREYYKAERMIVATNSYYTANARQLAAVNHVELWDRDKLSAVMLEEVEEEQYQPQKHLNEERICPKCGGHLVLRNGRYGEFYGCENYPACKYTRPLQN